MSLVPELTADATYGSVTHEGCLVQIETTRALAIEHVRAFASFPEPFDEQPSLVRWLFRYHGTPVATAEGETGVRSGGPLATWSFLTIAEDWKARMRHCAHWVSLSPPQRERESALFTLEHGVPLPPFQRLIPQRSYTTARGLASPQAMVSGLRFSCPAT